MRARSSRSPFGTTCAAESNVASATSGDAAAKTQDAEVDEGEHFGAAVVRGARDVERRGARRAGFYFLRANEEHLGLSERGERAKAATGGSGKCAEQLVVATCFRVAVRQSLERRLCEEGRGIGGVFAVREPPSRGERGSLPVLDGPLGLAHERARDRTARGAAGRFGGARRSKNKRNRARPHALNVGGFALERKCSPLHARVRILADAVVSPTCGLSIQGSRLRAPSPLASHPTEGAVR